MTSEESVRCGSRGNLKREKRSEDDGRGRKGKKNGVAATAVICGKQIIVRAANHRARWPTSVRGLARDENPAIYWPIFFRLVFERHRPLRRPAGILRFFPDFPRLSLNLDWRMFVLLNEI